MLINLHAYEAEQSLAPMIAASCHCGAGQACSSYTALRVAKDIVKSIWAEATSRMDELAQSIVRPMCARHVLPVH